VLAGAWTDTGWPATLEGAVLSGHTAAAAALRTLGIHRDGTQPPQSPALATTGAHA
nr:FAD-dependent oxidoreductase [Solirubrobacterales bacterium]